MSFDEGITHTAFLLLARHAMLDHVDAFLSLRRLLKRKTDEDPAYRRYVSSRHALHWLQPAGYASEPSDSFMLSSFRFPAGYFLPVVEILAATLFPESSKFWVRWVEEEPDLFLPRAGGRWNAMVECMLSHIIAKEEIDLPRTYPFGDMLFGWAKMATSHSARVLMEKWSVLVFLNGPLLRFKTEINWGKRHFRSAAAASGNLAVLAVLEEQQDLNRDIVGWVSTTCGAASIEYYQAQGRWDWDGYHHYLYAANAAMFGVGDTVDAAAKLVTGLSRLESFARSAFYLALSTNRFALCRRIRDAFPDVDLAYMVTLYPGYPFRSEMARLCSLRPGLPFNPTPDELWENRGGRTRYFSPISHVMTLARANLVALLQHTWTPQHQNRFLNGLEKALNERELAEEPSRDFPVDPRKPRWSMLIQETLRHRAWDTFAWLTDKVRRTLELGELDKVQLDWKHAALMGDWEKIRKHCRPDGSNPPLWCLDRNDDGWRESEWESDRIRRLGLVYYAASFGADELEWVVDTAFQGILHKDYHFPVLLLALMQNDVARADRFLARFSIPLTDIDWGLFLRMPREAKCEEAVAWLQKNMAASGGTSDF
jgi:hypothetical protein